ncbi:MAG: bactofilin family protein [Arsenophonus sp. NC-WZS1-MAG3]
MFKNKKLDVSSTNIFIMKGDKKNNPKQKEVTTISEESFFKGNITILGDIHVWGHIKGNITVTEGTIHIMQSGKIEGEVQAPDIIIDGLVDGACLGNNLDILENGELRGISRVSYMSIKRGGIFIGQSERLELQSEEGIKLEIIEEIPKNK